MMLSSILIPNEIEAIYCSNHKWSQLFHALTKRNIQFQMGRKARIYKPRNIEQKTNNNPENLTTHNCIAQLVKT